MIKKNILWVILLISTLNSSSYAQRFISLQDARDLAIESNKELKMATEEERVAYYEKKEAYLKYFPKLSANGAYLRNQKDIYLLGPSVLPPSITLPLPSGNLELPTGTMNESLYEKGRLDTKNIWVAGISLTQPLFAGGRIVAYNDIMKNAEELAKAQKNTHLRDVITEVDAAYWQTVSLADKKKLAESYLLLLKKMTSDISIMEEEGVATKADVLSVLVKMNEAEVTLTKVENGLGLSRMLLNQLCGLPIEEDIKLIDENSSLSVETENVDKTPIIEVFGNRPEIKSLKLAHEIYKGKEKLARAEFLPTVGLTANYIWTNPNSFNGFETKMKGMWSVGIVLNVPLNIFTSSAKMNIAKAQTRIQEYKLEEVQEKIELQVNQSSFKLNEARKKYIAAQKNMEKANENLRYANVGFEEGVISASDVMSAQTAWLSAHSDLIDSQIDVKLCGVYLNKALGRNLE